MLILRDVLAWPAAEVAELLETSVAAVNSGLQRARSALPVTAEPGTTQKRLTDRDREVALRFVAAWNRSDITALAALLREDAILRMPPERVQIQGAQAVTHFFGTIPAGGALEEFRLAMVAANGSPAVAAYLPDHTGRWMPYGLMVLDIDGALITAITGFPQPSLFPLFGLPDQLQPSMS